jgi:hypothetical protein
MSDIPAIPATSATQIAASAIRKSQTELRKDASVIANPNTAIESNDAINAMVDARQQLLYTRAAARMIRTADEMLGSLIDQRA